MPAPGGLSPCFPSAPNVRGRQKVELLHEPDRLVGQLGLAQARKAHILFAIDERESPPLAPDEFPVDPLGQPLKVGVRDLDLNEGRVLVQSRPQGKSFHPVLDQHDSALELQDIEEGQRLEDGLFFCLKGTVGFPLALAPLPEEPPAAVLMMPAELFVDGLETGLEPFDQVPLPVELLALEFGQLRTPVDVIEILPALLDPEVCPVRADEILGETRQAGRVCQTGGDRSSHFRLAQRRQEVGRLEGRLDKETEVAVEKGRPGPLGIFPDEDVRKIHLAGSGRIATKIGFDLVPVLKTHGFEGGIGRQAHEARPTMIVQDSRSQPSHQAVPRRAARLWGTVAVLLKPSFSKNPGMAVAK